MLETFKNMSILKGCTDEERQAVADICRDTDTQAGDRIFEVGAPADCLYFVVKGAVELRFKVTHYLATDEITIARIRENEVFGWSALEESKTYTLSALVAEGGGLLEAPAADLSKLCSDNHHLGYVLMKNLSSVIGERFELMQRMLMDIIQTQLDDKERRM